MLAGALPGSRNELPAYPGQFSGPELAHALVTTEKDPDIARVIGRYAARWAIGYRSRNRLLLGYCEEILTLDARKLAGLTIPVGAIALHVMSNASRRC